MEVPCGIQGQRRKLSAIHIHNIIKDCAPILYALRIIRAHGMNQSAVKTIYHSVVISKLLLYAAPAWWGFATPTDRNCISGFFNRGGPSGFSAADHTDISEMVDEAEDKLFH